MKKRIVTILLILVFVAGLSLMLYPTVSDWWNASRQTRAIVKYTDEVEKLNAQQQEKLRQEAIAYNQELAQLGNQYAVSDEQLARYERLLNVSGIGIMGYVEIPKLDVKLPIYHGTAESVLQVAVGHLEWTSLPVGGESTHCVISGHRGLPSAKLFTDLPLLAEGDIFTMTVLDQVLSYEVDQIRIVLPYETEELLIRPGEDLCTLVTCTPYGVNTHRLLVRGHRIETEVAPELRQPDVDALQIEPALVAVVLAVPMLLILFIVLMLPKKKSKDKDREA